MFTVSLKKLLSSMVCLGMLWLCAPVWAQEDTATPEAFEEEVADQDTSESISVTFEDTEEDILSREAQEKLEVVVESLEFSNADLRNVIRIIGERLNINFIFDSEDISGKITLRLRNVRLRDAMDSILTTRKLALVNDRSGIFRIVPQEQVGRKRVETRTEVIQLNWISAEDVKKTMETFLSDDIGKMEFNEESNTVIVTDVPPQIEVVRRLIEQIDIPERQVMIEARLVDVNIGALRNLGTEWSMSKLNEGRDWQSGVPVISDIEDDGTNKYDLAGVPYADRLGVVNNLLEGFSFNGDSGGTMAFGETVSILGNDYAVNAVFTALETRNVVEILASPRVATINNVPANIAITEKIPYISGQAASDDNVIEIEFEEAGLQIDVKPIVSPNKYVRLEIKLDQRIFRGRVGDGALDPPAIDGRMANTNIIVKDQHTAVLGGLRQLRRIEDINGLPWLHRIPVIGWLFKTKRNDSDKTELVLMITPKVIEDDIALTDIEREQYDRIDMKWHLPDWFYDDVQGVEDEAREK